MVDQERVCCMCGDVGFADKLFRCSRCRFRFQHLYCSNYYYGSQELLSPSSSSSSSSSISSITKSMEVCDWCQSEGRNSSKSFKRSSSSSSMGNRRNLHHIRSEYTSAERIKQHQDHHQLITTNTTAATTSGDRMTHNNNNNNNNNNSNNSGVPSPRPSAHRRYKLLKDVMC